jgi:hypothetical protein
MANMKDTLDKRFVGLNYSNGLLMSSLSDNYKIRWYYNCDYIFSYDEFWLEIKSMDNDSACEVIHTTNSKVWFMNHFTKAPDGPTYLENYEFGNIEARRRADYLSSEIEKMYGRLYDSSSGYGPDKLKKDGLIIPWKVGLSEDDLTNINIEFDKKFPGLNFLI